MQNVVKDKPKIALVGAGLIGRGWAIVFARAGHPVSLYDRDAGAAEGALRWLDRALPDLRRAGLVDDGNEVRARVSLASDLEAAVEGAAYVQESVPEDVAIKAAVCGAVAAAAAADAVIASSASAIPGSRFLAGVAHPERALVAHPANPPHLLPLVELVPAPATSEETVETARALLESVGQIPVLVRHEIKGFVMNRLQAALVNEAVSLIDADVIDPDDLDLVIRWSLGLRWAFMGPFETMDLNAPSGFLDYAERYGGTYSELGRDLKVGAPWRRETLRRIEDARRERVAGTEVGARQDWRDRRLAELRRHIDAAERATPSGGPRR